MPETGLRLALERTPNPAARRAVFATGLSASAAWTDPAAAPPLAAALLSLAGVAEIAAGPDFLTVRADSAARWDTPAFEVSVLGALLDARLQGLDLGAVSASTPPIVDYDPADAEVVALIESLIAERLRPFVEGDGGEITLVSFRDGVARIALRGACSGCPSSAGTLRAGVERLLRHYVPEVVRVEPA